MTTLVDYERALLNSFAGAREIDRLEYGDGRGVEMARKRGLVERSRFTVTDAGRSAPTRPGQRL
jgi:hypothetical protein